MAHKDGFYEGKRLSYGGALCTVRYYGPLAGTRGSWIGVEWDDWCRGKHDGIYEGQRIFSCLSKSKTAASFVRPTRPAESSRTFLEALRFKYGGKVEEGFPEKPVEISGKIVEEVGFEKIRQQQAELRQLHIAVLDDLQLCGISRDSCKPESLRRAQNQIAQTCPNIIELDLGWSLLETWQDVADICLPLTKLRILKVSGVRLHSFSISAEKTSAPSFANVQELHLNQTLLRPAQLAEMLNHHFPQLKVLSLAENELDSFASHQVSQKLSLPNLSRLVVEKNLFSDLNPLMCISTAFPKLLELSLQQNIIETVGELKPTETSSLEMFRNLRSLNLSGNRIGDFHFVDVLSLLFPNLASLRISNNPLYRVAPISGTATARSDVPYSFTLARIPSLTILNHTTVTSRDREEGEIYYISAAGKEITDLLEASSSTDGGRDLAAVIQVAKTRHPRYEALCNKYDRNPVFEQYSQERAAARSTGTRQKFATGTLAARLVNARFHVPGPSQKVLHRPIARTIDVYRIKALISREMELLPLQFRLVYESEELDPIHEGFEQNSSDWDSWGDWDVDGNDESNTVGSQEARHETWNNGVLLRDGQKWKKREVEIVDGTKAWGDYIDDVEIRDVMMHAGERERLREWLLPDSKALAVL